MNQFNTHIDQPAGYRIVIKAENIPIVTCANLQGRQPLEKITTEKIAVHELDVYGRRREGFYFQRFLCDIQS